jgi:hypothetical protein
VIGDTTDPGLSSTVGPNLTPYFSGGGKILEYHGLTDQNTPYATRIYGLINQLTHSTLPAPEAQPTTLKKSALT